jgi:hypothetical protein
MDDNRLEQRNMTRRSLIPIIATAAQAAGQVSQPSNRERLIGVWKLISIEVTVEGKILYPYGEHPIGRLTYDRAGRASAHVMKLGRKSSVADPSAVAGSTEEELRQIADGYVGYFGTFEIEANTVTHHIEACTLPAWTATDQKRQFEFAGNELVLRFGSNKLVWQRLPG